MVSQNFVVLAKFGLNFSICSQNLDDCLLAHACKIILLINRGKNNRLPIKSSWPLNRGSIVFCISVLIEKILVVLPFTKLFIEQGDNAVE